jgi:hypothetical protein
VNKERFKQVLDQIQQHPETWKQDTWHCGTTHCFAGWAQILSGCEANTDTARRDARIWLDLSIAEADWLFSPMSTMENFVEMLENRAGYNRAGYDRDGLDPHNKPREVKP